MPIAEILIGCARHYSDHRHLVDLRLRRCGRFTPRGTPEHMRENAMKIIATAGVLLVLAACTSNPGTNATEGAIGGAAVGCGIGAAVTAPLLGVGCVPGAIIGGAAGTGTRLASTTPLPRLLPRPMPILLLLLLLHRLRLLLHRLIEHRLVHLISRQAGRLLSGAGRLS